MPYAKLIPVDHKIKGKCVGLTENGERVVEINGILFYERQPWIGATPEEIEAAVKSIQEEKRRRKK